MKRMRFLGAILCVCLFFTVTGIAVASDDDDDQQTTLPWPSPRFTANTNGTVTDNLTGLIWLKDANCFGVQTWAAAVSFANTLANGQCGLSDGSKAGQWRLPSRKELHSLVNRQLVNSAAWLNLQGFSKVQANFYWSSSSGYSTAYAWYADMGYGGMHSSTTNFTCYVWPVRGGQ